MSRTILTAILLIIGAALWSYALTLSPYGDETLFMERYMRMSAGQSQEYWKLRDEMLTPKYQLEDYGITLVAAALLVFIATRQNNALLHSPNSPAVLVVLALVLPFLTVGGYVFDLFHAFGRGEFPHWADSMGIPLMGTPVLFIVLLVWSLAHLSFLRSGYCPSTPLVLAVSFKSNWWLLFVSAVTTVLVLSCVAFGQYWYAIPGVLWLYLYLSLGAVHRATKGT